MSSKTWNYQPTTVTTYMYILHKLRKALYQDMNLKDDLA
jgi:hypothetical protein